MGKLEMQEANQDNKELRRELQPEKHVCLPKYKHLSTPTHFPGGPGQGKLPTA